MKLRWLVRMTRPTVEQVRDYRDQYGISDSEAMRNLSLHEGPVLQYLTEDSVLGSWKTVPTVVETIEIKWKPDESRTRQTTV